MRQITDDLTRAFVDAKRFYVAKDITGAHKKDKKL